MGLFLGQFLGPYFVFFGPVFLPRKFESFSQLELFCGHEQCRFWGAFGFLVATFLLSCSGRCFASIW